MALLFLSSSVKLCSCSTLWCGDVRAVCRLKRAFASVEAAQPRAQHCRSIVELTRHSLKANRYGKSRTVANTPNTMPESLCGVEVWSCVLQSRQNNPVHSTVEALLS